MVLRMPLCASLLPSVESGFRPLLFESAPPLGLLMARSQLMAIASSNCSYVSGVVNVHAPARVLQICTSGFFYSSFVSLVASACSDKALSTSLARGQCSRHSC